MFFSGLPDAVIVLNRAESNEAVAVRSEANAGCGSYHASVMHSFDLSEYRLRAPENILTPALLIYPAIVQSNIDRMIGLMSGNADRWRPHLKTAKMDWVIRKLAASGVKQAKCATTLELLIACESGMEDMLIAFAHNGANARRILEIARAHPAVRISTLIESADQITAWTNSPVGLFVDINPGMNRTGVDPTHVEELVARVRDAGAEFRGLHYYDGHINQGNLDQRTETAQPGYEALCGLARRTGAEEVVTAGTPALPCSLGFAGFQNAGFTHRVSPGTVVFNDSSSLRQLPELGFRAAALVLSRVISHPTPAIITCDAGHKSLSVDSGVPNCQVLGYPGLLPQKPSEEHLPIEIGPGVDPPVVGGLLYLLPRHVCPTVNNFDYALMVQDGEVQSAQRVSARGREHPLLVA
ncbi:MAG: alanine racemase [Bryobacteraceae bacterium]